MTQTVKVRPVPGRLIFMPDQGFKPVPDEGVLVHRDAFYERAIMQGDLEVVTDEPAPAAKKPNASK